MNKKFIKKLGLSNIFFNNNSSRKIFKLLAFIGTKEDFFSYHLRNKNTSKIIDDSIKIKEKLGKVGIILQGPIQYEDSFTYETLKLYKNIYPNSEIILSIWKDEKKDEIDRIRNIGVIVVENDKPETGGFINLNYQIVSTKSAVLKAKELGCKYILKSRTDIRIYETGVDKFLISLLKNFPTNSSKQEQRIIGIDINTHKYGIGISDIFQFGTIEEMEKMWNVDLVKKITTMEEYLKFEKNSTAIDRFNFEFAECYLMKKYLLRNEIQLESKLENYYKVLKDNFIIIDSSMINMYWNKYLGDEYKGWKNYDKFIVRSSMTFKDWLTIYSNDTVVDEKILKLTYDEWRKKTIKEV